MLMRPTLFKISTFVLLFIFASLVYAASSEDYVNRANAHLKKGELKSAVIELKNALQKDAKNAKARVLLGQTYLKLGDGVNAEKELDRAIRLGENTPFVQIHLGRAFLLQGKTDELIKQIKDSDKYPSKDRAEILTLHAQAYLLKQDKKKAQQMYQKAIDVDGSSINAQLGLARLAILDGNIEMAEKLVKPVIKNNANSDEAWAVYGEVARKSGDQKLAKQRFEKALAIEPYNKPALLGKASVSIALNDFDTAVKTTDLIRKLSPNHPLANYLRSYALFKKKDIKGAEEAVNRVFKVAPNHIPSLQIKGNIEFIKGHYEQAGQLLTQVLTATPNNDYAAKLLAAARLKTHQPKQAIEILTPFAKNTKDAQLLSILGSAYIQNNENDVGMELLEKAMEIAPKAAGIQTKLAMAQLLSGENTKAVESLESAVELSPDLMQAEVMLVLAHMQNKDYDKAIKTAKSLQKKNSKNPVPLNLIGAAYLGSNQRKEARKYFEQAIKLDPKFTAATVNLAKMDEQDGNTEKAIERYKGILKKNPGHVNSLMALARIEESQGRIAEAVRYMEKANELNPSNVVPGAQLVRYYLSQKNPLKALSIARIMKDNAPDNPLALKSLGMAQAANKEYNSAFSTFQSMEKLQPESPEAPFLSGKVYIDMGDNAAAKRQFEKSLKLKPDYLPAQLALIDLELRAKHTAEAVKIAKQIQKHSPEQAIGYQVEGDIYLGSKEYKKAISKYKKAMEKSGDSNLVIKLSSAYTGTGKNKESFQLLEKWTAQHPNDFKAILLLASNYQTANKNKDAIKNYLKVLKNRPKDVVALNNIAWLYQLEKNSQAIEFAERAYDIAPDNPAIADTYGWLLVSEGKASKGLTILQQAAVQAPHMHDIRYHLAFAMYKTGREKEARKELERLLENAKDFSNADDARKLLKQIKGG